MNLKNTTWRIIIFLTLVGSAQDRAAFAGTSERVAIFDPIVSNPLSGRVLIIEYENGNSFELTYSEFTLIWKGIKVSEEGKSEQDQYLWSEVGPEIYLISWVEKDGTFVNTVVNLQTLKVYSSGIFKGLSWFWTGKVTIKI